MNITHENISQETNTIIINPDVHIKHQELFNEEFPELMVITELGIKKSYGGNIVGTNKFDNFAVEVIHPFSNKFIVVDVWKI